MSKKSIILISIIVVMFLLSFMALYISSNITRNITNNAKSEDGKAKIDEMVITETREGQKFWELYASSGQYDNSQNGARLFNIKGNFYKNKKVVLSFDAPVASYIAKNKKIKLSGGTKAATDGKIFITADELSWVGNSDEIHASGNVKISKGTDFLIKSEMAVFSTDFKKFKVIGKSQTNVYKKG